MEIKIGLIPYKSQAYFDSIAFRSKLLREPLGLIFSEEDIDSELDSVHIVATNSKGSILATLVLSQHGTVGTIRQVAVDPSMQSQGIGKQIMAYGENHAKCLGCTEIHLHARITAQTFYESIGYQAFGKEFVEVTIPHIAMKKILS